MAIIAAMLLAMPAMAQTKKGKTLEVSFNYQKQAGPGSNQYAVWIENEKGEVVKTLFVTSFTTKGRVRGNEQPMRGYVKRPNCVPTWVKTVKAESLSDQQLDGVTGATPQANGKQTFTVLREGGGYALSGQQHRLYRLFLIEGQGWQRDTHLEAL